MEKHDQCSGPDELNELLLYNYIKWVALVRVAVGRTRAIYCCSCAWARAIKRCCFDGTQIFAGFPTWVIRSMRTSLCIWLRSLKMARGLLCSFERWIQWTSSWSLQSWMVLVIRWRLWVYLTRWFWNLRGRHLGRLGYTAVVARPMFLRRFIFYGALFGWKQSRKSSLMFQRCQSPIALKLVCKSGRRLWRWTCRLQPWTLRRSWRRLDSMGLISVSLWLWMRPAQAQSLCCWVQRMACARSWSMLASVAVARMECINIGARCMRRPVAFRVPFWKPWEPFLPRSCRDLKRGFLRFPPSPVCSDQGIWFEQRPSFACSFLGISRRYHADVDLSLFIQTSKKLINYRARCYVKSQSQNSSLCFTFTFFFGELITVCAACHVEGYRVQIVWVMAVVFAGLGVWQLQFSPAVKRDNCGMNGIISIWYGNANVTKDHEIGSDAVVIHS